MIFFIKRIPFERLWRDYAKQNNTLFPILFEFTVKLEQQKKGGGEMKPTKSKLRFYKAYPHAFLITSLYGLSNCDMFAISSSSIILEITRKYLIKLL